MEKKKEKYAINSLIIEMFQKELKPRDISNLIEVSETTVHDVISFFKNTGGKIMENISKPKLITEEKVSETIDFFERNQGKVVKVNTLRKHLEL